MRNKNPWYIYFMEHRGGFDESQATARAVNPVDLKMNFPLYEFYSFDGRCGDGSMRFIIKDMVKATAIGMPCWIVFATLPKEKWGRV